MCEEPVFDFNEAMSDRSVPISTRRTYAHRMRAWVRWGRERGFEVMPANPEHLALYFTEEAARGLAPNSLRGMVKAIAYHHKRRDLENPVNDFVRLVLNGLYRMYGRPDRQAEGLTERRFAAIRATSYLPRKMGMGLESRRIAKVRGLEDIALMGLMRDGMLRSGEAGEVRWCDLSEEPDGSGRLLIRRSKTDQAGRGEIVFASSRTMGDLAAIRDGDQDEDFIFGFTTDRISNRIKTAAKYAGLGDGFSGHSPRVGMAQDLAIAGVSLAELMTVGRWKSAEAAFIYIRHVSGGDGAVAQYHGGGGVNRQRQRSLSEEGEA